MMEEQSRLADLIALCVIMLGLAFAVLSGIFYRLLLRARKRIAELEGRIKRMSEHRVEDISALRESLAKAKQEKKQNAEVLSNRLNSLTDEYKQQKEELKQEIIAVLNQH